MTEDAMKDDLMSQDARDDSERPPFDPAALVAGVVFIVLAVLALLDPAVARRTDLGIVWSLTFVGVGAALLATTLRSRGTRRDR
jgi:uncharacterized membrane protein HdeD (DUF308 family)